MNYYQLGEERENGPGSVTHGLKKGKKMEIKITKRGIQCNECGKKFFPGNDEEGLPNGVGFQLQDGSIYNICKDCLIKKGMEAHGNDQ